MPERTLLDELRGLAGVFGLADGISRDQREEWADALLRPLVDYPQQGAIGTEIARGKRHVAVNGTRRSGKSELSRMIAALCILRDAFVVRILTSVLRAPTANFLEREHDGGVLGWLEELGLYPGITDVDRSQRSIIKISFPWKSAIIVCDVADESKVKKHHGVTANLWWADEATMLRPGMLSHALKTLVYPTLADHGARILLTFTPDDDPGSLPSRLAAGEDPEWEYHQMASWRNPRFGQTFEERWTTVLDRSVATARTDYGLTDDDMARLRGLSEAECDAIGVGTESEELRKWVDGGDGFPGLDPAFLGNIFGRQSLRSAAFVYSWHRIEPVQLYWVAQDERSNHRGLLAVHATLEERADYLLSHPDPGMRHPTDGRDLGWRVVIGVDIGYYPDPWAITAWAWSPLHESALELHSEVEHRLPDSEMYRRTIDVIDRAKSTGLPVSRVVGDLCGPRVGTQVDWDYKIARRFPRLADGKPLHLVAPAKGPKPARRRIWDADLMAGRVRVVAGSALDIEGSNLRYRKDRPDKVHKEREITLPDGRVFAPGNHCLDTALYSQDEIRTLTARPPSRDEPVQSLMERQYQEFRH